MDLKDKLHSQIAGGGSGCMCMYVYMYGLLVAQYLDLRIFVSAMCVCVFDVRYVLMTFDCPCTTQSLCGKMRLPQRRTTGRRRTKVGKTEAVTAIPTPTPTTTRAAGNDRTAKRDRPATLTDHYYPMTIMIVFKCRTILYDNYNI